MKQMNQQFAIFRNFASLTVAALLAGCASAPPATQMVEVPVYAPCVKDVPTRPDYEFGKLSVTDNDGDKVLALTRDWVAGRRHEQELRAALAGCI